MKDPIFQQPSLETQQPGTEGQTVQRTAEKLPEHVAQSSDAALGNDALSNAVRSATRVSGAQAPEIAELPAAKFALDYVLNGEEITETHIDEEHAIASYKRLRALGIQPHPRTI